MINSEKLNILLLSVNSTSFFYDQIVIPFGLVSIASYVDNPNYDIKGIELNQPPKKIMQRYLKVDNDILDQIKDFRPDIVAMSTYASNMHNVAFWANTIKDHLPQTFVVVGGNHVSYIAEECLQKSKGIDGVIRFEGEIPFKKLCENLCNKTNDLSDVPNLTYRSNGRIIENHEADLIDDLKLLPVLKRTYFENRRLSSTTHADIISARGCRANCTFCNCNHYWKKTHRVRSVDSVIDEIRKLNKDGRLKSIRFRDESITLNKKHCIELCDKIIQNNIKLDFQAHSRLDGLDEEVILKLAQAGFRQLFIGVESGSKKVLKRLKKGINIEKLKKIVPMLRKHGIAFRLSFMSATPSETFRETLKTVKLIKSLKLKRDEYYIGIGVDIYPGTEECTRFLEQHPDFEFISKKRKFTDNYSVATDCYGNIIKPRYRQYGPLKTGLMFFLLSPGYFIDNVIILIKNKSWKLLRKIFWPVK